jgi:hypothetical protein
MTGLAGGFIEVFHAVFVVAAGASAEGGTSAECGAPA